VASNTSKKSSPTTRHILKRRLEAFIADQFINQSRPAAAYDGWILFGIGIMPMPTNAIPQRPRPICQTAAWMTWGAHAGYDQLAGWNQSVKLQGIGVNLALKHR
jgi:hypothetical protein